jgi:hypothetical protein
LLEQGLVRRTPRGRVLTAAGFVHLGLSETVPSPEKECFRSMPVKCDYH